MIGKVRDEGAAGRKALWDHLRSRADGEADRRVDQERQFASRGDLHELGTRLEERLEMRLETAEEKVKIMLDHNIEMIRKMIDERPPVRTP